jgi:hypothetical protein
VAADQLQAVALELGQTPQGRFCNAQASYYRALRALEEGEPLEAAEKFAQAREMHRSNDQMELAQAAHAWHLFATGQVLLLNDDAASGLPALKEGYNLMKGLYEKVGAAAPELGALCLEMEFEVHCVTVFAYSDEEDFDDAAAALGDVCRLKERICGDASVSRMHHLIAGGATACEAGVKLAMASAAFDRFSLKEATRLFAEAKNLIDHASTELQHASLAQRPRAVLLVRLLSGRSLAVLAQQEHCHAYELLLAGKPHKAYNQLLKAHGVYDVACAALAQAGKTGIDALKRFAEYRDTCKHLAEGLKLALPSDVEGTMPLHFVASSDLRAIIERDYEEVLCAYASGAWKPCVVGVGGIVEALLVDLLQRSWSVVLAKGLVPPGTASSRAFAWVLSELLERAEKTGLLTIGNLYIADVLRDFRNLIHPAKELRSKHVVSAEVAAAALRALQCLVRELGK